MSRTSFIDSLENYATELYTEDEINTLEQHIIRNFGEFTNVFHEVMSSDIHVDIYVIEPDRDRDYYTLVTLGMGAHRMPVPEELRPEIPERAEVMITLPSDWKVASQQECWSWPVHLLKTIARLPVQQDTWIGWGHTVDNGGPFSEDTLLCGSFLVSPQQGVNELNLSGNTCRLSNGEKVAFYHIIPVYRKEMEFKKAFGPELLIEYALEDVTHVVDLDRPDGCSGWDGSPVPQKLEESFIRSRAEEGIKYVDLDEIPYDEDEMPSGFPEKAALLDMVIDDGNWHEDSIRSKSLPVDPLNAYSHLAVYFRWCCEHDLMSLPFRLRFGDRLEELKSKGFATDWDLRSFIKNTRELSGCLILPFFDENGAAFTDYYYRNTENSCYLAEIDRYAIDRVTEDFGRELFEEGYFKEEEYLFVPCDERYYRDMKKILDSAYDGWRIRYMGTMKGQLQ